MAVVNLILETLSELSTTYLVSNLPRPIKKFLFNSQIKKIKKVINKIPEDNISFETIVELCRDAFTRYYSYKDKVAKFENMGISIYNYNENPPLINNNSEYNIRINISEKEYIRILLQPTNDYNIPNTYRSMITIRINDDKSNTSLLFISSSFDKYQEISTEIIEEIATAEKLSDTAVESYKLVLQILCTNLKKYLNSYIGVYDKINL